MSELRVLPDIYRLNARQRDALLDLYNEGRIQSPVTVTRLSSHRAGLADQAGGAFVLERDGSLKPPTSRR